MTEIVPSLYHPDEWFGWKCGIEITSDGKIFVKNPYKVNTLVCVCVVATEDPLFQETRLKITVTR